jgi:hypothetical protein
MAPDMSTTNVYLGIIAVVSLLEAIVIIGAAVAAILLVRQIGRIVSDLEERQVAPAMSRVNAILDDVKGVTATVKTETGRINGLIEWAIASLLRRRSAAASSSTRVM